MSEELPCGEALLLAALRAAPRRYRMPPLPAGIEAAKEGGAEAVLAFAIEAARVAQEQGGPPLAAAKGLFTRALAELIRTALRPEVGDPAFQAQVLEAREPAVGEHVRLLAQAGADRRGVRSALDAIAHPGKLRHLEASATKDALSRLHRLAQAGEWPELRQALGQWLAQPPSEGDPGREVLEALHASPGLGRLERGRALLGHDAVQRYQVLRERCGPPAGSDAALAKGRAATRVGAQAEALTAQAFQRVAELLNRRQQDLVRYRVVQGLRMPGGFPGEAGRAKDEWDVAIVRGADAEGPADLVLLAEVKASPAAATPDFSRLVRGLQRLARVDAEAVPAFPCAGGTVRIAGRSLRGLHLHDSRSLLPQVIYCCTAPPGSPVQVLAPASRAVLLAEPASIAFACRLAQGGSPGHESLDPVWEALSTEPRLRATLHQYETARRVREAMLQPQDLVSALASEERACGP